MYLGDVQGWNNPSTLPIADYQQGKVDILAKGNLSLGWKPGSGRIFYQCRNGSISEDACCQALIPAGVGQTTIPDYYGMVKACRDTSPTGVPAQAFKTPDIQDVAPPPPVVIPPPVASSTPLPNNTPASATNSAPSPSSIIITKSGGTVYSSSASGTTQAAAAAANSSGIPWWLLAAAASLFFS